MNILQIFYLLILVSTISFGTVRLKSLTFPLKIIYTICLISLTNEILVHYVIPEIAWVYFTYHCYNYLAFFLYYTFFVVTLREKYRRSAVVAIGVVLFAMCFYADRHSYFSSFPSFALATHSVGLVLSSFIFIAYRLNNPSETSISQDSNFIVVLLILVYWAVFVSKHALQSEIIRQGHKLDLIEVLFTTFCMCYYCGLGIVFYRHKTNESRPAV